MCKMAGLHCSDCALARSKFNEDAQMYQAYCSARLYLLADPHIHELCHALLSLQRVLFPSKIRLIAVSEVIYHRGEFIKLAKDNLG